MGCALGHDMVAEFQGEERDRESGRSRCGPYDKSHECKAPSAWQGSYKGPATFKEGMVTPTSGRRLVHATGHVGGTYIDMTII